MIELFLTRVKCTLYVPKSLPSLPERINESLTARLEVPLDLLTHPVASSTEYVAVSVARTKVKHRPLGWMRSARVCIISSARQLFVNVIRVDGMDTTNSIQCTLRFAPHPYVMSFLIRDGDSTTLDEIVAIIDSWDTGSTSPSDATDNDSSPFSNEEVESVLLDSLDNILEDASFLPKKEPETKKPAKKKRKKAPGASTRLQRRKRAEILSLKAQSEQLERRLDKLKHKSDMPLTYSGSANSSWISWSTVAATQYKLRLQSEMTNQKLRLVLMEQMKMNNALRDAFQVQASLGNLDAIFGSQFGPTVHQPILDNTVPVISELEKMVEGLYLDSAAVFPRKTTLSAPTLRVMQERTRGRVFEITATTTLQCSIQEASELLWRDFLTVRQYNDKFYHFLRQRKPSDVEKKFTWVLRSDTEVQEVEGFTFVRKIKEPNRVVLVEADRFLLPMEGLQFRIQRWTIITRSEDEPKSGSIIRTLIQIHADCAGKTSANGKCLEETQDLILEELSARLRDYLQGQQKELAAKLRKYALSAAH